MQNIPVVALLLADYNGDGEDDYGGQSKSSEL